MTLGVSSSFSDKSMNLHDRASVESVQVYISYYLQKQDGETFKSSQLKPITFNVFTYLQKVDINVFMLYC